jgi:hypothetical protein
MKQNLREAVARPEAKLSPGQGRKSPDKGDNDLQRRYEKWYG